VHALLRTGDGSGRQQIEKQSARGLHLRGRHDEEGDAQGRADGLAERPDVQHAALAYVLFFRLIARVGAAKTMAVPFLVPAFGVLWGVLFLGERITTAMAAGSAPIVLGTALATGVINPARPRAAHPLPRPGARQDAN
jgi:hypothetical protein